MAIIMDGKALAVNMQEQLQEKVARLKEKDCSRTSGNYGWRKPCQSSLCA